MAVSHRVLVVEDEPDMVDTYERLLRRQGYEVVSARTLADGLRTLSHGSPDLLIADVELPDGNGLDVVRMAHRLPVPPPAVVVTGFASTRTRETALAAGATAVLIKPFATDAFLDLVRSLLPPAAV